MIKKKEKKKRGFLSSFSICFLVVLLAAILSWVIPAGNYDTLVYDEGSGQFVVYSADYDNTAEEKRSPKRIPQRFPFPAVSRDSEPDSRRKA